MSGTKYEVLGMRLGTKLKVILPLYILVLLGLLALYPAGTSAWPTQKQYHGREDYIGESNVFWHAESAPLDGTPNNTSSLHSIEKRWSFFHTNKNRTAEKDRWRSGPNKRGTFNILFSCTTTIALAIWSGILVNVQMAAGKTIKRARKPTFVPNKRPATKRKRADNIDGNEGKTPQATTPKQDSSKLEVTKAEVGPSGQHTTKTNENKDPATVVCAGPVVPDLNPVLRPVYRLQKAFSSEWKSRENEWKKEHEPCKKNAEEQVREEAKSWYTYFWGWILMTGKTIRRSLAARWNYKLLWAALTVIMPELSLIITMGEKGYARRLLRALKEVDRQSGKHVFDGWDMKMAYYVVMGGFYLEIIPDEDPLLATPQTPATIPAKCPIGRRQELDNYMHSAHTLGRRISSVNCTRIHFHVSKINRKRANPTTKGDIDEGIARTNRRNKHFYDYPKKNAATKATPAKENKLIPKPREVLTPHGLLYIAALCSFYKEDKPEGAISDKEHVDPPVAVEPGQHAFKNQILDPEEYKKVTGTSAEITEKEATLLQLQLNDMNSAILDDMSKGDWIAKILFVFQAAWMILQVSARRAAHLPIVVLELHAAAHVAMAVVQYLVWWSKPIDIIVASPITLTETQYKKMMRTRSWEVTNPLRVANVHQQLLMEGRIDEAKDRWIRKSQLYKYPESTDQPSNTGTNASANDSAGLPGAQNKGGETVTIDADHDKIETQPPKPTDTPDTKPEASVQHIESDVDKRGVPQPSASERTPFSFSKWWTRLLALDQMEELSNNYVTSQSTLGKYGYKNITKPAKIHRDPIRVVVNVLIHLSFSWHRWPFHAAVWFLSGFAYGAIHICGWWWLFPSDFELKAWRVTTAFTVGSVAILMFLALLMTLYIGFIDLLLPDSVKTDGIVIPKKGWRRWFQLPERNEKSIRWKFVDFNTHIMRFSIRLTGILIFIGLFPWVVARGFMLVEAYISMRRVEKGSYETLDWLQTIPHLG